MALFGTLAKEFFWLRCISSRDAKISQMAGQRVPNAVSMPVNRHVQKTRYGFKRFSASLLEIVICAVHQRLWKTGSIFATQTA